VDFSGVIWTLMFGNVYERDIILSTVHCPVVCEFVIGPNCEVEQICRR